MKTFHAAFGKLRVAHQLGDGLVGALDLLPDNFDLLGVHRLALLEGALDGVGGVVDDAERILDLVGNLRRQTARRT